MFEIPILFVIYNRTDTALKSFESIKRTQPLKLYIAGDGPNCNKKEDILQIQATRQAILNAIDWNCEVKTLFQQSNLGCGRGVYTAINWLFDNEEQGIIIEDDCVMKLSFFKYAEQLLSLYNNDSRIGMICGANYAQNETIPDSYVFSRYKSCHGWATWKRAWELMDINMKWRNSKYSDSIIKNMGYKSKDLRYWKYRLKAIDIKDVSAWDWQWYFSLAANDMLAICPKFNLTSNIGFGKDATHTSQNKIPSSFVSTKELDFPLQHPKYIVPYQPFEKAFYHSNNTLYNKIKQLFPFAVKNFIKKIVRK